MTSTVSTPTVRPDGLAAPALLPVVTLTVDLAPPIEIGLTPHGMRRVIPITGGTVAGPAGTGRVLPGGADWNLVRADGITHLWARYTIAMDDGAILMITNEGWGTQDEATMQRIFTGGEVDPASAADWYCRTNPRIEAAHPDWAWLGHTVLVGDLRPPTRADQVVVDIYRVS